MGLRRKKFEEEVKKCPQCGAEYQGYPEFCDECGYDFASDELSETEQEEPVEEKENDDIPVEEAENEEDTVEEPDSEDDITADEEENEEDNAVDSEEDSEDSGEEIELTAWEDLDTEDDGDIAFEDEDILDEAEEEPEVEDSDEEEPDNEFEEPDEEPDEQDIEEVEPEEDYREQEAGLEEDFDEEEPEEDYSEPEEVEQYDEDYSEQEEWLEEEYTALEKATKESIEVKVEQLDFSEAVEGPSIIAYETEDGYKVVTAPKEIMIECLVCDEAAAKVLKADYRLQNEYLTIKEKAEIYSFLKENEAEAQEAVGFDDINEFYGEPADLYAEMTDVSDELLETDMTLEVIAILAKTTKEQQKLVAKVINKYDLNRVTVASAKLIADGKKTEDEIKEILMQDERMFEIIKDSSALELLKETLNI